MREREVAERIASMSEHNAEKWMSIFPYGYAENETSAILCIPCHPDYYKEPTIPVHWIPQSHFAYLFYAEGTIKGIHELITKKRGLMMPLIVSFSVTSSIASKNLRIDKGRSTLIFSGDFYADFRRYTTSLRSSLQHLSL